MKPSSWSSELELVDALERRIQEKAVTKAGRRLRLFREFDAGFGRVDLVGVWYDPGRLAARVAECRPSSGKSFGVLEGYAMTYLSGLNWVSREALREALRLTARRNASLVAALCERGLVEQQGPRLRARPISSLWFLDRIEAYEAKLDKWRDAAEQASRHLWFASKSYVALPRLSDQVLRKAVDVCHHWYLGLCVLRDRGTLRVEPPAPRRKAPTTQVGWVVNEMIFEEVRHAAVRSAA